MTSQAGQVERLYAITHELHRHTSTCGVHCTAVVSASDHDAAIAALTHRVEQLEAALERLVSIIDKAGGPLRLSGAVQLGPVSWCVKASDAMHAARTALSGGAP